MDPQPNKSETVFCAGTEISLKFDVLISFPTWMLYVGRRRLHSNRSRSESGCSRFPWRIVGSTDTAFRVT